jgi:shikimate kinase
VARLVLVGLPGVGKTTVARALAELWQCEALDTDDLVAAAVAMAPAHYLREFGEAHFRERELDALCAALASDAVVATGAGIVTNDSARELIAREFTLWLDVDNATLIERVAGGERPLLGDDHAAGITRLRRERDQWYQKSSRRRVNADGSLENVLERITAATREDRE